MIEGVLDLRLEGRAFRRAVVPELKSTIERATRLRMAIAFWTIDPDVVSPKLKELLRRSGSFVCVDLHPPTHIDHMCRLAESGTDVFINVRRIKPEESPDGVGLKLPGQLLHAKTALFDLEDGTAELWIGSHNWTERALSGLNVEQSLVVRMTRECPLYAEVVDNLEKARAFCDPCEPELLYDYMIAQGSLATRPVVVCISPAAAGLGGQEVHLFGTRPDDLQDLDRASREILLVVRDEEDHREYVYGCRVVGRRELPRAGTGATWSEPDQGLWALFSGGVPRLELPLPRFEDELGARAAFFATLLLRAPPNEVRIFEPPEKPGFEDERAPSVESWKKLTGWFHPSRVKAPAMRAFALGGQRAIETAERVELVYGKPDARMVRRLVVKVKDEPADTGQLGIPFDDPAQEPKE